MVLSGAAVKRRQNGVTDPLIQEKTGECLITVLIQNTQLLDNDEHSFNLTFWG
jgi:hypothetical protein